MENQQEAPKDGQIHRVELTFTAKGFEDALALCRKGSHPDIAQMSRAAFAVYKWFLEETARNTEILTRQPDGLTERVRFVPEASSGHPTGDEDAADNVVTLALSQEGLDGMEALRRDGKHQDRDQMSKAAYAVYGWYLGEVARGSEIVVREADGSTARVTFSDPMAAGGEDG